MDFEELRTLVALAERESVAGAAAALDTSRARIRRKLAALEQRTGMALLTRVDGKLQTTPSGQGLLEGARRLLDEGELLINHTREMANSPSGLLTIALQPGVPPAAFATAMAVFRGAFPALRLEIRVAENPTSLLPHEADIALYVGGGSEVEGCTMVPVTTMPRRLLGSSGYTERHGTPERIEDLSKHRLGIWLEPGGRGSQLALRSGGFIEACADLVCSDEQLLRRLAEAGEMLVYVPAPAFESPGTTTLSPMLESKIGDELHARLFFPSALAAVPRIRAVATALAALDQKRRPTPEDAQQPQGG